MPALLRVILDTSAINHIEDGGQQFEPLLRGLDCGFEVILPATSADEILFTSRATRRQALRSRFGRLLSLSAAWCIMPPGEIVRRLVDAHAGNAPFDWMNVDVRARGYEAAIPAGDFDDAICAEGLAESRGAQAIWRTVLQKLELRPKHDQVAAGSSSDGPQSYHDYSTLLASEDGILAMVGRLYEAASASGKHLTDPEARSFVEACAPFRALCYGLVMAKYNESIRLPDGGPKPPGRIDILMAAYLPYCSQFVTDDWPQRRDLPEVAAEAGIDCTVLSLEEFNRSLTAAV